MRLNQFEKIENLEMVQPRNVLKYEHQKTTPKLSAAFNFFSSTV